MQNRHFITGKKTPKIMKNKLKGNLLLLEAKTVRDPS